MVALPTQASRVRRLWIWWTSGKDAARVLYEASSDPGLEVQGLFALVNGENGRAETHGVGKDLLARQAAAVGLPLHLVEYDWRGSSTSYERLVVRELAELREAGADAIAFPELSARRHRERSSDLAVTAGLEPAFPLWGRDARGHASAMLKDGLVARVCSLATDAVSAEFAGRSFDEELLADLPPHVDPCGEEDEFHTFVEWAPGWLHRVAVEPVRTTDRYGYAVAELLPGNPATLEMPSAGGSGPDGVVGGLPRLLENVADHDPFRDSERLRRVKSYVDARLGEELDVGAVAVVASMTPSGFGRFFRRHVGVTFGSWLAGLRVAKACDLLRDPDLPVARVASASGLGTDRNLRRVFRQLVGCSPSEYRRRHLRRR